MKTKPKPTDEDTPPDTQGQQPPPPPDQGDEPHIEQLDINAILPHVHNAASTITGCSDNELKNFLSTADFVARRIVVQLAEEWKNICKIAREVGKDDKPSVVKLASAITIDHSNLLMAETSLKTTYVKKTTMFDEETKDLTQAQLKLVA